MNRARMLMTFVVASVLSVLSLPVRADEPVAAERRVVVDTLAYFSLRSVPEFKTKLGETWVGKLSREESLAAFRTAIEKQFKEISGKAGEQLGMPLEELLAIPHGEVALGLFRSGESRILDVVLLLDYGDKEQAVQQLLDKAVAAAEKRGHKRTEEEYEDARIVVFQHKPEEDDEEKQAPQHVQSLGYCLKDTFLICGGSAAGIKSVLSRWDGKHPETLAENDVYRQISEACREEDEAPLMTWYVDPVGIFQASLASQEASPQAAMMLGFLPVLGIDKFRGVGGSISLATEEYDSISRTLIVLDEPATGVLGALQFPATGQTPPKWVSADAVSYLAVNWDLAKAYDSIEGIVDSFQGAGWLARTIDQLSKNPALGNLHVKRDLIDQLTGELHLVGQVVDGDESDGEQYVFAARIKNAAALKGLLAKWAELPGFPGKARAFQGETIYEFASMAAGDEGEEEEEEDEEDSGPTAIAIAQNHLMIASHVPLLEQVLRNTGDQETLADSSAYRRIAERLPTQTSMAGFQKQAMNVAELPLLLQGLAFGLGLELPDDLEFSAEARAAAERLLPPSGMYVQPVRNGLKAVTFTLKSNTDR